MRTYARAIVIRDNNILVMKRFKVNREYFTLLGGKVEPHETPDLTAIREVKEESTIDATNPRLVFIEEAVDPYGVQYVYLCDYVSGEPVLPPTADEVFWTAEGKNTYTPTWVSLEDFSKLPFVSELLKEAILTGLKHGWPGEPFKFSSKNAARLS